MSESEQSEGARALALALADICVSSAQRRLMAASLKKADSLGLKNDPEGRETLHGDNESK